eukprot:473726-Hanusia_phi.AAC.1
MQKTSLKPVNSEAATPIRSSPSPSPSPGSDHYHDDLNPARARRPVTRPITESYAQPETAMRVDGLS